MSKKTLACAAGLLLLLSCSLAAASPWGCLKKIYFYEASGNLGEVRRNLEQLDSQALPPGEKIDLLNKLSDLGDRYYQRNNDSLAEAFYRQTLKISPLDAWPAYNKLEKISRRRGGLLWNFTGVGKQFALLTRSFSSAILLLDGFFSVVMFSGLLLFFMFAAALAIRYFKLAAHDFILEGQSRFSLLKLLLLLLLLLWPLLVTGGWAIYPFLLCGFLWNYFNHDERVNIKRIQVLLLLLAFFYGLGQYLEKSMQSPGFQTIQQVYSGQLFPASAYGRFDNELKVMQAYAYYHSDQSDTAMDILLETGSAYASTLKYNLLGNIHFEKGNIPQSIQFYQQSSHKACDCACSIDILRMILPHLLQKMLCPSVGKNFFSSDT